MGFVRFAYRRRPVAWPDLYDELWAVATCGAYRGWGTRDLEERGFSFCLGELPRLAQLVKEVTRQERQRAAAARSGSR